MPTNMESRVGETRVANNGMKMTIIAYRNSQHIDVRFEDGTIITDKSYGAFRIGEIGNPNLQKQKILREKYAQLRIGEKKTMRNGMRATVIAYRSAKSIDIQFEDKVIVHNVHYTDFKKGSIDHPEHTKFERNKRIRTGMTNTNSQGIKMTIVEYRRTDDIDVQFEDGYILEHVTYRDFSKGRILHPKHRAYEYEQKRIGQTIMNNQGLNVTIINYRNTNDLDVLIADTQIVKHRQYYEWRKQRIACPLPLEIGTISVDKPAYIYGNNGNFFCHCTKCGITDILDMSEIKSHKCDIRKEQTT